MEIIHPDILRKAALQLHNEVNWEAHPCRKGRGMCCEGATPVTKYDQGIIMQGVKSRDVSRKTIKLAARRARVDKTKCGFLDEERQCVIYPFRPIMCIMTGVGGLPNKLHPEVVDAIELFLSGGPDVEVPTGKLVTSMCPDCAKQLTNEGATISTSTIVVYNQAMLHYGQNPYKTMNNFIPLLNHR